MRDQHGQNQHQRQPGFTSTRNAHPLNAPAKAVCETHPTGRESLAIDTQPRALLTNSSRWAAVVLPRSLEATAKQKIGVGRYELHSIISRQADKQALAHRVVVKNHAEATA